MHQLCVPTDAANRGKVWVELLRSAQLLDMETGALEDAALAPDGCTATTNNRGALSAARADAPQRQFSLDGASVTALYEDDLAVGDLEERGGTKFFVGLEASTSKIRWKLPRNNDLHLEPVLELRGGRAHLAREQTGTAAVDCVDARTGAIVLTATMTGPPPHDISSAVISSHRVYLTVDQRIDILALETGKRTGTIRYRR